MKGILYVAKEAAETSHKIIDIQKKDKIAIYKTSRESSKIVMLHDRLFDRPIVSIGDITKMMDTTFPTANTMCMKLVRLNILKEITGRPRSRMFVYKRYLDILKQEE